MSKGEFDLIETYFAPLAAAEPGSLNLKDDAAVLRFGQGRETVVTTDCLVSGVHFLPDDPPETLAAKLIGVNFSDLASMGATPRFFTIAAAFPRTLDEEWVRRFAEGIKGSQARFGGVLVGGDTVSTDGAMTLTLTAFGEVPEGTAIKRSGAKPGDALFVTGVIGDAYAGLRLLQGGYDHLPASDKDYLTERYRKPSPQLEIGDMVRGIASAMIDVSDGLAADLGHLCEASGVGGVVDSKAVPLSSAVAKLLAEHHLTYEEILTGGDDYELLFSVPANKINDLEAVRLSFETPISRIGTAKESREVIFKDGNIRLDLDKTGYQHF